MEITALVQLGLLISQTVAQMIAEGRTQTNAAETAALQAAQAAQASAEQQFDADRA